MKMKKYFIYMLAASLTLSGLTLDEFKALKEYIDYAKYPNFKLGAGTTVNDYLNKALVRDQINKNFSETVAGNAMKMASCVDNNGNMNFTTVKRYVEAATEAGINVYGHTLAWHSQQPKGWLLRLLADKQDPAGGEEVWTTIASKDFRKDKTVGWKSDEATYGYTLKFDNTNGLNIHTTQKNTNSWDVQFLAMTDIPTQTGKTYKMTMTVKGSEAGNLHSKLGDWGSGEYPDIPFTTEWQEVEVSYKAAVETSLATSMSRTSSSRVTSALPFPRHQKRCTTRSSMLWTCGSRA